MKNYYRVILCLLFFIILCNHNKCFGCLEKERIGLLELKSEILKGNKLPYKDSYFSTWDDEKGSDCCAWVGVVCNNTTRQVIHLSLDYVLQLHAGLLWDVFGYPLNVSLLLPFEELQHLSLSHNYLTHFGGDFDSLSKLRKLQFLDLAANNFNNSFLPSLGALTSLKTLNLSNNNICGRSFLTQANVSLLGFEVFFKLQKLEELALQNNYCNNSILPFLSAIKSLKTLDLSSNNLEGSLSEFSEGFTNLSNLEVLNLEQNGLNSFLPFHDWTNTSKLKVLCLGYNNFSRGLPPSILTLNSLQVLSLPQSNLNGSLSGLCDLKNLRDLVLSDNKFEGILPPCFNNLTSLKLVDFSNNQLHIPLFLISDLKSLEYLSLSGNQFDGSLPFTSPLLPNQIKFLHMSNCNLNISAVDLFKFLHNQYNLRFLDLSHNNLHGSFPNWLVENNTRLENFYLINNSLTGHIQLGVVGSLLSKFDVSKNRIEGKIQTDIGVVLSKILYLNLSKNRIEGTLPTSLGNMKNLSLLDLSKNNIEGTLPTSLGNMKYLEVLDFSSNKLSGEIPECWYNSKLLTDLILSNNRLNGRISPSIFNLTYLKSLRLSNNHFTGSIPNHNVGSFDLETLDVSQNHMSGRIPSWIGQSSPNMVTLILRNNSFHGLIPLNFCNSSHSIEFLDLSHNRLSGSIPSCLNLTSLKYMHLQENKFFAPIPKSIIQSSNLITLDLRHNNLSGNIPRWFGFLKNLKILLLKGNHFRGSIPRKLCQLTKISILDLSCNTISGSIPSCFSNINFGKNGSVERAFDSKDYQGLGVNDLEYEDVLYMRQNFDSYGMYLTYPEQEEVEFMTKSRSDTYKGDILNFMAGMDLSCNNITGDIPTELGALTSILALNLSHNQLTGSIPSSLSNLHKLESMDLSYNKLTGEIPSEFIDIYTLAVFTVAYNNLTGRIPDMKAQFSTFGETSYEGNMFLCGPPLQHQCNIIRVPITTTNIGWSEKLNIDPIIVTASFAATYIVYLLGFVVVLCINPYWRRMWFNFIDECLNFMFPFWSEVIYK